jgi:hypothetical protein
MMAIAHLRMVMMVPTTTPQICHPLPLLNSPSLLRAIAMLIPHHIAETWAVEALIQTAVPLCNMHGAAGQAVPRRYVWVPPRLLIATYIMVAAISMSVSAYMTVHLLLMDTVMALIPIVQGAALHHMQVAKAEAAVVTAVAIAAA